MAATVQSGHKSWNLVRDEEGHRDYRLIIRVECAKTDGPFVALSAAGLPTVGSSWNLDGDVDPWAFCLPDTNVNEVVSNEPNTNFDLEFHFSTRPPEGNKCNEDPVTDPLLEPQKVSGDSVSTTEEATKNRFGLSILTSSHEQIRGPQNEWDKSRDTISIEQNVASLDLATFTAMRDTLNDSTLWGMLPRTVKLSKASWERKYYGTCNVYYTRKFQFDINPETWDRTVLDEGTKVLNGHWDEETGDWVLDPIGNPPLGETGTGTGYPPNPNRNNPTHFIRFKDRNGENSRVILDGTGLPYDPEPVEIVTTCTQCPTGAPKYWYVGGLSEAILMTYISACLWEGHDLPGTATGDCVLEYIPKPGTGSPGVGNWTLIISTYGPGIWKHSSVGWNCMGPNVMTKTEGNGPYQLVVYTLPTSQPGRIRIEKYNESNFLLLGIPSTF